MQIAILQAVHSCQKGLVDKDIDLSNASDALHAGMGRVRGTCRAAFAKVITGVGVSANASNHECKQMQPNPGEGGCGDKFWCGRMPANAGDGGCGPVQGECARGQAVGEKKSAFLVRGVLEGEYK